MKSLDREFLDKVREGLLSIVLTREDVAAEVGINYQNFTKFLKGDKGLSQESCDRCIAFLRTKGIEI